MHARTDLFRFAGALGLLFLVPAARLQATTYTYTGNEIPGTNSFAIMVSFTAPGPLLNLAPNTDITGLVTGAAINHPPQDLAGFPEGTDLGDFIVITPLSIHVGTDSVGNITSWNISETAFISYPAFPGENPNDFFCTLTTSTSTSTDSVGIVTENDAGFCPGGSTSDVGTWSPVFGPSGAIPEPSSMSLAACGAALLLLNRKKRAC